MVESQSFSMKLNSSLFTKFYRPLGDFFRSSVVYVARIEVSRQFGSTIRIN
jgi:hypothetical protein